MKGISNMGKHRTIYVRGETISVYDSPDEINHCLSCTLPASKCAGEGHCKLGPYVDGAKTKASAVREYAKRGMSRSDIAIIVGLPVHTVSSYICHDVQVGRLTVEEARRTRSKKSKS